MEAIDLLLIVVAGLAGYGVADLVDRRKEVWVNLHYWDEQEQEMKVKRTRFKKRG